MTAQDLLTAALTNLASLEHHVPKLDRLIYLAAIEQIEQARAGLAGQAQAPAPYQPLASFQPVMED